MLISLLSHTAFTACKWHDMHTICRQHSERPNKQQWCFLQLFHRDLSKICRLPLVSCILEYTAKLSYYLSLERWLNEENKRIMTLKNFFYVLIFKVSPQMNESHSTGAKLRATKPRQKQGAEGESRSSPLVLGRQKQVSSCRRNWSFTFPCL